MPAGPAGAATGGTDDATRDQLLAVQAELTRRVEELEQDKRDLEVMLETSTQHADNVSSDLVQERDDLATMLEMTTEHVTRWPKSCTTRRQRRFCGTSGNCA